MLPKFFLVSSELKKVNIGETPLFSKMDFVNGHVFSRTF